MNSAGDSFSWPLQDPNWAGKLLVQGLINLIPIVGWIATFGWAMMLIDNYRAGRKELPPAGFHLARGIALFVVYLVWAIVFGLPGTVLQSAGTNNDSAALSSLGGLVSFLLSLLLAFLAPAIIMYTYRGGFGGGFDIGNIWSTATANVTNSVIAGLLIWVASLIASFGLILCCVGIIFTAPYAVAIIAGVVTWYSGVSGSGGTAMTPSAPPAPPAPPTA
jgi:uncharacterized protein DUF4013